jgi:hypothetical protein
MKKLIEKQKKILANQIKKHIDVFQPEIEQITPKIFKLLKPELEKIKLNHPECTIFLFPVINFYANDIAPNFNSNIWYFWNLVISNQNDEFLPFLHYLTPEIDQIIQKLEKEEIYVDVKSIFKSHVEVIKNIKNKI